VGGLWQVPAVLLPGRRHGAHCTGEVTQHDNSNLRNTTFANYKGARRKFLNTEYIWGKKLVMFQYDATMLLHKITSIEMQIFVTNPSMTNRKAQKELKY
jgi:hypothetical protein